jgi:chromosome segregation ATPase
LSRSGVISTAIVLCPFCGKGPLQLDARVCDRCGMDVSNFWITFKFLETQSLLRKPVQSIPLKGQRETDKALTGGTRSFETRLSALVPRSKPDLTHADSTRLAGIVGEKSKLAETVPRTELEIKESETESLRKERDNLRERVRDLEAQLVESVARTRLEAEQSETENLRTELSRLRDDKAQSEARIEKLSADLTKALQSAPASKLVDYEVRPQTVEEDLRDLTRGRSQREPASKRPKSDLIHGTKSLRNYLSRGVPRSRLRPERKCGVCGFNNRVDAIFCSSCGVSLFSGPS